MASFRALWPALVCLVPCLGNSADPSIIDSLRQRFPQGIPWHVEFKDMAGSDLGSLDLVITSEPAKSCLGSMGSDSVRARFERIDVAPTRLRIASYGIVQFTGYGITIDLTGDTCDAYLLMSGSLASDGSSTGELYTLGIRGGRDVGTYHATIQYAK